MKWNPLFTTSDPFNSIKWVKRNAKIAGSDGRVIFEQKNVEVPEFWSQTATDVVASKYFRGQMDSPEREKSAKQMINRVAKTITEWGLKDGYFDDKQSAENFENDLKWLLVNQFGSFNSPVWFNVGIDEHPQCSACFILSVEDDMNSILKDWYATEGMIFKHGSGSGINLSNLRSSKEPLSKGGTASGPVSFMQGADGIANTIKSGGRTRRAAKMVILNADHPDIKDFIYCKKIMEDMSKDLAMTGKYDTSIEGKLFSIYTTLPFQNANNSVRVTDEFMEKVKKDEDWELKAVKTGKPIEKVKARDILNWCADAAWHCADPGMQYDTTINKWHTCPNSGRINASNPCFTGDTIVYTNKGLIKFRELYRRILLGEKFEVYTHNITNKHNPTDSISLTEPSQIMTTGINPILELTFSNGLSIKATPNHKFFTNRGWVEAKDLTPKDQVKLLNKEIDFKDSNLDIEADIKEVFKEKPNYKYKNINLPTVWTTPFAEYMGYLIGDGNISKYDRQSMAVINFSRNESEELIPRFRAILEQMHIKPSIVTIGNNTIQLRATQVPFVKFLKQIGIRKERNHLKEIPYSIFKTPKHIIAGFLRGLFSADGYVYNEKKHRYIGLENSSKKLLQQVQQLLLIFGIQSTIYENSNNKSSRKFSYRKKDGTLIHYYSKPLYDLRITNVSIEKFKDKIGFLLTDKQEKLNNIIKNHKFYRQTQPYIVRLKKKRFINKEITYNLTEPKNHSYIVNGIIVSNCSEYMHVDNSSCNLASLNLLKFLKDNDEFDIDLFKKAVDTFILAQDIIVDNSSYPTEKITKNAKNLRQLGLGFANLGALLMALGLPYDSDKGRAFAGAISSIMGGEAYRFSTTIAKQLGPFAEYYKNKEPMTNVIKLHREYAYKIPEELIEQKEMINEARSVWDQALLLGQEFGFRNSQVTVIAPTGTIAFMMDCDTTGIEPELALIKYKKLVGGGTLKLVNKQVKRALKKLGYNQKQIDEIIEYIDKQETIEGAPHIKKEHIAIFDFSFKPVNGSRSINYLGHLKMMSAVQPFISGAISKTINLPNETTKEEIFNAFITAWELGLKAVAFYRDGCKTIQPLSTEKKSKQKDSDEKLSHLLENGLLRKRLPDERPAIHHKFSVGGHEGYINIGLYPDTNKIGETFINMAKEGSTIAGLMDTIAILTSICLQYGIPLKVLVRKLKDMRFEPMGVTTNKEIPYANSVVDYVFRYLGMKFLPEEDKRLLFGNSSNSSPKLLNNLKEKVLKNWQSQSNKKSINKENNPTSNQLTESPKLELTSYNTEDNICPKCGFIMVRSGSCMLCRNCGEVTGVCSS